MSLPSRTSRSTWPRWFLAPAVAVLALTTVIPLVYSIVMSLGSSEGQLGLGRIIGLGNYGALLTSIGFWMSTVRTVVFLIGALAVEMVLGVAVAMLVHKYVPGRTLVRMLLLWPAILPPIAVALIFKFVLQGDIGMVSYYLALLGYHQAWLTSPTASMVVIIVIDAWQYTPFVILLTLAALQGVPDDTYEAAVLDGATGLRIARHILLPIIKPTLLSILTLRFIDAIQVFPTIYVLTRGGPGASTQLLTYYNFQLFFGQLQFGRGSAMAVLVVAFTLVCVVGLFTWQRRVERTV